MSANWARYAARTCVWCGGAGFSKSSRSDTRIECQTIQAATWLVVRMAILTISCRSLRPTPYATAATIPQPLDAKHSRKIAISAKYVIA